MVAWANIKMYPIYKIVTSLIAYTSILNTGKVGALDVNEFQEEIVLGTNEYTKHLVWENTYLLGKDAKIDGGKEVS